MGYVRGISMRGLLVILAASMLTQIVCAHSAIAASMSVYCTAQEQSGMHPVEWVTQNFTINQDPRYFLMMHGRLNQEWQDYSTATFKPQAMYPRNFSAGGCEATEERQSEIARVTRAGYSIQDVTWQPSATAIGTNPATSAVTDQTVSKSATQRQMNRPTRYAKECLKMVKSGSGMLFRNACSFTVSVGYCSTTKDSDFACKPDGKGSYSGGGLIQLDSGGTYPAPAPAAAMTCKGTNGEVTPRLTMLHPIKGQCLADD